MEYEYMLRQFLGEKAYHTEGGQFGSSMKKRIRKCIKKTEIVIDKIDTDLRHKELMLKEVGVIEEILNQRRNNEKNLWQIIFHLLMLTSRLLGLDYLKGTKIRTVCYFQTENQHYTETIFKGGDPLQDYYDKKNLVSLRKNVYKFLKNDGLSDFRISQVLNISEYEIKKLKNNII